MKFYEADVGQVLVFPIFKDGQPAALPVPTEVDLLVEEPSGTVVFPCTITDRDGGIAQYTVEAGDFTGTKKAQLRVTYSATLKLHGKRPFELMARPLFTT